MQGTGVTTVDNYNNIEVEMDIPEHAGHWRIKRTLQNKLRKMENDWWKAKADELESASNTKNTKEMYNLTKEMFGPKKPKRSPLRSADGNTLLTDKNDIHNRMSEHFCQLLNRESAVDFNVIESIEQYDILYHLDTSPSLEEVGTAVDNLNRGKSPGLDNVPPEVLQHGGSTLISRLHQLIQVKWEDGSVPQEWKDAILKSLYKNKGESSNCNNYRGIALLSSAGKVLAKIINKRLGEIVKLAYSESQSAFRPGRGTDDMIFTARQLQEKCREQQLPLYQTFIDLEKAFDSINRDALWRVLEKFGVPPKMLQMIKSLHEGMEAFLSMDGTLGTPFPVKSGVKQGCILAPILFGVFFAVVLFLAILNFDKPIFLRFRTSGSLFNLSRLKSKTKVSLATLIELLYADDCDLVTHSEVAMQELVTRFNLIAKAFGLKFNIKKTEVMFQPSSKGQTQLPSIKVEGQQLKNVDSFVYLGSTLTNDCSLDKEINLRISKATGAFKKLQKRVWKPHSIKLNTKIEVYRTCVLSKLLYASSTWTCYRYQVRKLEQFHQRSLRSILSIKWQDKVTNIEVLEKAQITSIECMLMKNQLRWLGHCSRMDDTRLPKMMLYGELKDGKRKEKSEDPN